MNGVNSNYFNVLSQENFTLTKRMPLVRITIHLKLSKDSQSDNSFINKIPPPVQRCSEFYPEHLFVHRYKKEETI